MSESSSFLDFRQGLEEVRRILKLANGNAATDQDPELPATLLKGAVVLLVAHFEAYLKSIAEEFSDAALNGERAASRIPMSLRMLHTRALLDEIRSARDEQQLQNLLSKKLVSNSKSWVSSARPDKQAFRDGLLKRQVTNATADCINELFRLMGERRSVCDGDVEVSTSEQEDHPVNIALSLRSIVQVRNNIAHGNEHVPLTDLDVQSHVLFIEAFAKRLDRHTLRLIRDLED